MKNFGSTAGNANTVATFNQVTTTPPLSVSIARPSGMAALPVETTVTPAKGVTKLMSSPVISIDLVCHATNS